MSIEAAMEYFRDAVRESDELIEEMKCSEMLKAELLKQKKHFEVALVALREQERREQGCEYCTPVEGDYGYQFGKDFPYDGGHIAICIRWNRDGDATLHSEAFEVKDGEEILKDYSDTPIRRCPMCGRKLGGAN